MSVDVKGKPIQSCWVLRDTGYKISQYHTTQYIKLWKLKTDLKAMLFRSKSVTVTPLLVAFNQITNFCCNHTALFITASVMRSGGGARQRGKKLRLLEPEMCRVQDAFRPLGQQRVIRSPEVKDHKAQGRLCGRNQTTQTKPRRAQILRDAVQQCIIHSFFILIK